MLWGILKGHTTSYMCVCVWQCVFLHISYVLHFHLLLYYKLFYLCTSICNKLTYLLTTHINLKLDDSAFLRTQSYITEICYFEFLWSFEFLLAPHWDFFQKIHLFTPIHIQNWPKSKLGQVQVGSNIAQNHSSSP